VLDPIVRHNVVDRSLVRIKLWNVSGTVLYSDDPRLVGKQFPLDADARQALTTPHTEAEISDLQRPENRLDRDQGKLLEVYRPVWTPDGTPLLFETYFKYDTVVARSNQLWRGFAGIILTSIAALMLLLVPLVWALVNRTRHARADRDRATAWALEASDDERRHIAAALHDGVVQQLAATSFAAAGEAHRATSSGNHELGARLSALAHTVRDAIAGVRSLLVDIYPPSLHSSGLAAALRDLARASTGSGATVEVDIDAEVADALPSDARESTFRVVQEALRNAVRHSQADRVTIALAADASGMPLVSVDDNGRGFDIADTPADDRSGHFGLRLMADAAAASGARLEVASGAGDGTHLRLSWPPS
jgi:signal transduction histidine kinase